MQNIVNPLAVNKALQPIQSVLRVLASQENCDGEPYDQMMEAAEYIDRLEELIKTIHDMTISKQNAVDKLCLIHFKCDQEMGHTK